MNKASVLLEMTSWLQDHGLSYFLNGGTLLGLVRDNALISWDTDVDLSIDQYTAVQLEALLAEPGNNCPGIIKSKRGFSARLDGHAALWESLHYTQP